MKAFALREALFAVLRRFGLAYHFVEFTMRLHIGVRAKIKIGEEDSEVEELQGHRRWHWRSDFERPTQNWQVIKDTKDDRVLGRSQMTVEREKWQHYHTHDQAQDVFVKIIESYWKWIQVVRNGIMLIFE